MVRQTGHIIVAPKQSLQKRSWRLYIVYGQTRLRSLQIEQIPFLSVIGVIFILCLHLRRPHIVQNRHHYDRTVRLL